MPNHAKVFQGISKSTQRRFYSTVLRELRARGFEKVCVPFAGEFTLVKLAIECGFKPDQVVATDISAYSSVLGYLYSGQPLAGLGIETAAEIGDDWGELTPAEEAARWIWLMKVLQMKEDVEYERQILLHLMHTRHSQVKELGAKLERQAALYKGMTYRIEDARVTLADSWNDEKTVVLCHPPAYAKGYEKQFDFKGQITWPHKFQEFDFKSEFIQMFYDSTLRDATHLWSSYRRWDEIPPEHWLFAEQIKDSKFEFYLTSRPESHQSSKMEKGIFFKQEPFATPKWKIVPEDYVITENTQVSVKRVNHDVAMYYRDLWAHKLGITKAETYYLVMLDKMVFGVVGWDLSSVVTMKTNEAMEVFGFDAPLLKCPTSHRLFMMFLCSADFRRILMGRFKRNRIFDIDIFKTTCMTKFRKLKSSSGLLDIVEREKLPDGNYRLLYRKQFYKRGFKECIQDWLKENAARPMALDRSRVSLDDDDDGDDEDVVEPAVQEKA